MMRRAAGRVLEALDGRDAGFGRGRGRLAHLLPPVVVGLRGVYGLLGPLALGAHRLDARRHAVARRPLVIRPSAFAGHIAAR